MTTADLLEDLDGYITAAVTGLALVVYMAGFVVGTFGGR